MDKICTSIEQSKKLIELGIDVNTADMYWWPTSLRYYIETMDDGDFNEDEEHIRAWSLTALFNMLPKSARLERGSSTELCRVTLPVELKCSDWYLDPIDAVFEMVVWLKENGKL